MPRFRVSDESLNAHGFRVLSSGGDTSAFLKNPIMLWNHQRHFMPGDPLPIGKWENLKMEGDAWYADPLLDEDDEFAQKIADKVEKGIINMASVGIRVLAYSEDPVVLVPGQTRPTVTKWQLQEISLVDIGSNSNAVRLFDEHGAEIQLSDKGSNPFFPNLIKKEEHNMKSIALKLGLPENSTEAEILQKIVSSQDDYNTMKTTLQQISDRRCAALVDDAVAKGKITADKRDVFLKMAKNDFENAEAVLASMPVAKRPTDVIKPGEAESPEDKPITDWKQLIDKGRDAVEKLRAEDPQKYSELYRKHFGIDPKLD